MHFVRFVGRLHNGRIMVELPLLLFGLWVACTMLE